MHRENEGGGRGLQDYRDLAWDYSDFGAPFNHTWDGSIAFQRHHLGLGPRFPGPYQQHSAFSRRNRRKHSPLASDSMISAIWLLSTVPSKHLYVLYSSPFFYKETCCRGSLSWQKDSWSPTTHSFLDSRDRATVLLGPVSAFTASKEGITADWLFPQTASRVMLCSHLNSTQDSRWCYPQKATGSKQPQPPPPPTRVRYYHASFRAEPGEGGGAFAL